MDKSEREEERITLIERLKQDESQRLVGSIPDFVIKDVSPEDEEDYIVLAEHLRFLRRKGKESTSEEEKKSIRKEIFVIQRYMLIAEFGDRNIERFNQM